ncbi:unnamed protein product [Arctogadus glacialis]
MTNNQLPEMEKSLEEVCARQHSELETVRAMLQAQDKKISETHRAMSEMSVFVVNMTRTLSDLKRIMSDKASTVKPAKDVSCGTDRPATLDVTCATDRSCIVPGSWSPGPRAHSTSCGDRGISRRIDRHLHLRRTKLI